MIYLTGKCVENGPMYIFSMNICRPHVLFRLVGRKSPQPRVWTTKQKCGAQRLKSNYHSTPKPPTQIRLLQELIHCGHARSSARTMVTRWASIWAQSRSWSKGHGMGWAYICDHISLGHGYPLPPWRRELLSPLHLPCHRACTIYVMTPENSNRASVLLCNIQ